MAERTVELLIRILAEGGQLKAVVTGGQRDLQNLGRAGTDAGQAIGGGLDGASASMRRLAAQLGAGYLSFQGLRALFSQFTQVATDFERARVQLTSLFGDAEKGQAAFAWVKQFAVDTPFELADVLTAFQTLKNFGLDPMGGAMQAVADQASKFGGTQVQLQGISLALGQAWARQKLQGQDILQLINQGVPVWELLAQVTGKNTQELFKMSEAGELGRDVIAKFIAAMGEAAGGAAQAQMQTFGGMVSNVKDAWAQFLDQIAQSGALDQMKASLDGLLSTTGEMAQNGDLKAWADAIGGGLGTLIGLGRDAAGIVGSLSGELKILAELWVAGRVLAYGAALRDLAAASLLAEGPLVALGVAAGLLGKALLLGEIALVLEQFGKLAAIFLAGRDGARGMADAYDQFLRKQEQIIKANAEFADAQTKTAAEIAGLTRKEQDAYAERLRGAQAYWKAVFELESRRPDGDKAVAEQANRQVRAYQQALADLRPVLDERARVEQASADRIAALKADETKAIETELGRQKKLYDDANKAIEDALKERESIQGKFATIQQNIKTGPQRPIKSTVDVNRETASLRQQTDAAITQLGRGGTTRAATAQADRIIERATKAAEAVEELVNGGKVGRATGSQQVAALEKIALTASKIKETAAQINFDAAKIAIDELAAKGKALETLKVGFDSAAAITDAQALRAALEAELAANPIVVHVQLDTPTSAGADLLKNTTVDAPKKAAGGPLPGHSPTPTADNILFWGTAGEFLLPVPATRSLRDQIGAEGLELLRRGQVPGFAFGGELGPSPGRLPSLIDRLPPLPSLPANAVPATPGGTPQTMGVLVLQAGGRDYRLQAPPDTVAELMRVVSIEALKAGARNPR